MKTMKFFALTALALAIGLSSCAKSDSDVTKTGEDFALALKLASSPSTYADDELALPNTVVTIDDGYLCFVTAGQVISEVYTIGAAATDLPNKIIKASDLSSTVPIVITGVPANSVVIHLVANVGAIAAPAKGGIMTTYLKTKVSTTQQGDYKKVTILGSGAIVDKIPAVVGEKKADITMGTNVARIQFENLKFDPEITAITLDGIFINSHLKSAGIDNSFEPADIIDAGTTPANYVDDSAHFPTAVKSYLYDFGGFAALTTETITPVNGSWGYNVFAVNMPQVVLSFSGVTVSGTTIATQLFVTIRGFKDGATSVTTLEGGKIYTVKADTFTITPEMLDPNPMSEAVSVDVTVTVVKWNEVTVTPEL